MSSKPPTGSHTFSRQPHAAISHLRSSGRPVYSNIMHDRRVVRGYTFAHQIQPVPVPVKIQQKKELKGRGAASKWAANHFQTTCPDTFGERKHIDVQTELYLEELSDRIEEISVECQTDAFLDKPATPLFIPAKSGKDVATQIEEGELFDFNMEVEPLVEVLVGKTLEQALLEVQEEEELSNLRAQQRAFQELRNAELVEVQRLEEQERRLSEEKARRIEQQREVFKKEKETVEKVAARTFAQDYLSDLMPSVFARLRDEGYFYDPVRRDIETDFHSWLMTEVNKTLENHEVARTVLDTMVHEVIDQRWEGLQQIMICSPEGEDRQEPSEHREDK